tara:strand:+ start:522 stop:1253 length:732 start_codon:yes stop_codon:yes gene_type:complete
MFSDQITVVIAAAGKGTRSGLDYPKCLFKINNKSILSRIIRLLSYIDPNPIIIVSQEGHEDIYSEAKKYSNNPRLLIQNSPNGMGDAVLQLDQVSKSLSDDILLIWGDVPFISQKTVEMTINKHFDEDNFFTFPTFFSDEPYTLVKRDLNNNIIGVFETKNNQEVYVPKEGERDLGLFLFKKDLILKLLKQDLPNRLNIHDGEHGFLYIIEHLARYSNRIGSIQVLDKREAVSFNSMQDISGI